MRSPSRGLAAALVALVATAFAPVPSTGGTTASVTDTDLCGDDRPTAEVVLDEHDLCEVTATIDVAGDAPVLTIAFDQHGDQRTVLSAALAAWRSGDCSFTAYAEEGRGAAVGTISARLPAAVDVHVACGGDVERCYVVVSGTGVYCDTVKEHEETVTLLAGGSGVDPVLELTFDGPLAPYADLHDSGATIAFGTFATGPHVPVADVLVGSVGCAGVCFEAGTDFLFTEAVLVVPDDEID